MFSLENFRVHSSAFRCPSVSLLATPLSLDFVTSLKNSFTIFYLPLFYPPPYFGWNVLFYWSVVLCVHSWINTNWSVWIFLTNWPFSKANSELASKPVRACNFCNIGQYSFAFGCRSNFLVDCILHLPNSSASLGSTFTSGIMPTVFELLGEYIYKYTYACYLYLFNYITQSFENIKRN